MPDRAQEVFEAARNYLRRGWYPVPIPPRSKGAVTKGWPQLRLKEAELANHFGNDANIGLLLGEPSGWLVDVDLDCPEAIELADDFLPPTAAQSGRPSASNSHRWYIAEGCETQKHTDPQTGKMIAEVRSTGLQTIVGPSVHPDGETYDLLTGQPAQVAAPMLKACVKALANAVNERRRNNDAETNEPMPILATIGPVATADADFDLEARAIAYLDAMPEAISGSGGHAATYSAAVALVHGFGLAPERALSLLTTHYNPRCRPPWSEKELRHKIDDAASKQHARQFGWLRDEPERTEPTDHSSLVVTPNWAVRQTAGIIDPGILPSGLLRVPGLIRDVMEYNLSTAIKPQPILALGAAICLQAVLAARKVRDERGNRTNLYVIGVAESGAGKDHARKVNRNILFSSGLGRLEGHEDLASDSGLISAVHEQPGVLFQLDEIGRFLKTIGDARKAPHLFNVISALMKLYSQADTVYKGKAYRDLKHVREIDQPCVVLYGTSVPTHFFEALGADAMSDGFMARLLVLEGEDNPPRQRCPVQPIPPSILEHVRWWGDFLPGGNLRNEHPEPAIVPTTDAAYREFDRFAGLVDRERAKHGEAAALWARAEEKACRLALVYASSESPDRLLIDQPAANWACRLVEHITRRMVLLAHQWLAESPFDALQKQVLRTFRKAGGSLDGTQMNQKLRWMPSKQRREVVANLIETGQMLIEQVPTKTKPRTIYSVA